MKQKLPELWDALTKTNEWKAFNDDLKQQIKSWEHIHDFCEYSGTADPENDKEEECLYHIEKCIDSISKKYLPKLAKYSSNNS